MTTEPRPPTVREAPIKMCGGCGATRAIQRCIGCLHHFGDGDDWVLKYSEPPAPMIVVRVEQA